jgi:arylsulfatase A-like enzyme
MNVVWFVVDTLRADHLGCYGYFRDTSPNIDQIAREGVLFQDSYASAIATGEGFTSLLTGLAAINHGFYTTPWDVPNAPLLDDRILTLPELIQARGNYTTAAFDNLMNFRSHMKQAARGFEFYINITRSPGWTHADVTADEVNHRLLPWLEHHAQEVFFAFVHYWDPHGPYNQPHRFRARFSRKAGDLVTKRAPDGYEYVPGWGLADQLPEERPQRSIDLYDDEVYYTDYSIGLVRDKLEQLGLLDDTAILITADHGEDLGLHGWWGHSSVHNTTIHIPMIVRDPKHLPQGQCVKGFVQHADNVPTILEYYPLQERPGFSRVTSRAMPDLPTSFDGASLLSLARGERTAPSEIVVESAGHRCYMSPPWKLIWYRDGRPSELFHLQNDPLELRDRAAEQPSVSQELLSKLEAWVIRNLGERQSDPIYADPGPWTCQIDDKGRLYR